LLNTAGTFLNLAFAGLFFNHDLMCGSNAKQWPQPNQNSSATSMLSPEETAIVSATGLYVFGSKVE